MSVYTYVSNKNLKFHEFKHSKVWKMLGNPFIIEKEKNNIFKIKKENDMDNILCVETTIYNALDKALEYCEIDKEKLESMERIIEASIDCIESYYGGDSKAEDLRFKVLDLVDNFRKKEI